MLSSHAESIGTGPNSTNSFQPDPKGPADLEFHRLNSLSESDRRVAIYDYLFPKVHRRIHNISAKYVTQVLCQIPLQRLSRVLEKRQLLQCIYYIQREVQRALEANRENLRIRLLLDKAKPPGKKPKHVSKDASEPPKNGQTGSEAFENGALQDERAILSEKMANLTLAAKKAPGSSDEVYLAVSNVEPRTTSKTVAMFFDQTKASESIVWVKLFSEGATSMAVICFARETDCGRALESLNGRKFFGRTVSGRLCRSGEGDRHKLMSVHMNCFLPMKRKNLNTDLKMRLFLLDYKNTPASVLPNLPPGMHSAAEFVLKRLNEELSNIVGEELREDVKKGVLRKNSLNDLIDQIDNKTIVRTIVDTLSEIVEK